MISNNKNITVQVRNSISNEIDRKMSSKEPFDSIREAREGYRGTGFLQLNRLYASEGVYVIGIGGPPIVGK